MQSGDKLYSITHRELAPGYQAVQSSHAFLKFAKDHPERFHEWYERSEYLCSLSVENEQELRKLYMAARRAGIKCSAFLEPDVGYAMTAICLEPGEDSKQLCAKLQLALKEC